MRLEQIIASGNRGHLALWPSNNRLHCTDGFTVSVIAGGGTYCSPRPRLCAPNIDWCPLPADKALNEVECTYPGPYTEVEVGFPSGRPEPWAEWQEYADEPYDDGTEGVYSFVPVRVVRRLIEAHGGEDQ